MTSNINRTALVGKKLGMSQIWDENGFFVPVTLVDVSTNVVTAVKSEDRDGYKAVQLGYGAIDPTKVTKPLAPRARASPAPSSVGASSPTAAPTVLTKTNAALVPSALAPPPAVCSRASAWPAAWVM